MPSLLVVPDPPRSSAADAHPDLPALSELIRIGEAGAPSADWRAGLLAELGGAALASWTPAQVAAQAIDLAPGSAVCLASPVHLVAGMNRVHLHEEGVLKLDPAQRAQLAGEFAAQFGEEMRLHQAGEGWLLEAPWAAAADEGDPAAHRGAPLSRSPAATPPRRALRRAGAEIEMWLAGLAWNRQRERRGELPVNQLWLWGGGAVAQQGLAATLPQFQVQSAAADSWASGLAALGGHALQPLPSGWESGEGLRLLSCADAAASCWQDWERRWFAPALQDLRAGRITALGLRLGRASWLVRRRPWRALWRRSRPWWQALEA
jgi:hypothetical protein